MRINEDVFAWSSSYYKKVTVKKLENNIVNSLKGLKA